MGAVLLLLEAGFKPSCELLWQIHMSTSRLHYIFSQILQAINFYHTLYLEKMIKISYNHKLQDGVVELTQKTRV